MISLLNGKVELKTDKFLIIDTGGVGYRVFCTVKTLHNLKKGEKIKLFSYQHLRENMSELYGFLTFKEIDFFETLLSVSGIGPKAALSILNLNDVDTLKQAISSGQISLLTKVSGIGKKIAERIVLELKSKVFANVADIKQLSSDSEALDALISLGYTAAQARDALKNIPSNIKGVGNRVREALKILGK